jgi:NAD(P)-dependent dehydrogenase (short-subunit alcohol dehydrogenase family)
VIPLDRPDPATVDPETAPERRALVTGAGRGIGRAIALRLAADGFAVVGVGRDEAALRETAALIEAAAGRARTAVGDVTDPAALDALAATVGPVDALVCNSGIAGPTAPLWEVAPDEWEDTFAVNVRGVYAACRAFVPSMIARGAGTVVVIGSVSGARPLPQRTAYAASKTALTGLVRGLALDAGPHGVRVNLVSPGPTAGPRLDAVLERQAATRGRSVDAVREQFLAASPLRTTSTPEDVANAVGYLVSERARTVTGIELTVAAGSVM